MSTGRRLRIHFVSTVHPHPWSPAKGAFNRAMLNALQRLADVTAVVPVPWTERRGNAVPVSTSYPVNFPTWYFLPRLAPLALARQMSWCLDPVLDRLPRPDVVLSYWTDPDGTAAVRWGIANKTPVVQMVGGSDVLLLASEPGRGARILQTLHKARRVIAIGSNLSARLASMGLPSERVITYLRGVDQRQFNRGDRNEARSLLGLPVDRPILLWVGRMVPVKGLDNLVAALADPAIDQIDPLVVLIGDGHLKAALMSQVESMLPADRVRWEGRVDHDALPTWYRAADLMVLPSLSEGVPNVLLEALACGTGFVSSDVGSVAELTDHPERDLVEAGNVAQLRAKLVSRLQNVTDSQVTSVPDLDESIGRLHEHLVEAASSAI